MIKTPVRHMVTMALNEVEIRRLEFMQDVLRHEDGRPASRAEVMRHFLKQVHVPAEERRTG